MTNVDLHFVGVEYIAIPRHLDGLELLPPTPTEIRHMQSSLGKDVPSEWIKVLASTGKRFLIVSCGFEASENDWDIFESPIECRSEFRSHA
jgi:hypothetical protein